VGLGSEASGNILAWMLASKRQRAAVIERRSFLGPYANIACLPCKGDIHGSKVASISRRTDDSVVSPASSVELHVQRGRELCRCCLIAGLDGDHHVRSLA
jgi:pyruvate/2-oxoglutarate dehydrogenase complex dihydrolipoamide dehydrogenase (E3) component